MIRSLNWERTEEERAVCKILEEIAQEVGAKNIQAGASLSKLPTREQFR